MRARSIILSMSAAAALVCAIVVPFANAQTAPQEVESILDRLEKRLLDKEGEALSFGDETQPLAPPPPAQSITFEKAKITTTTESQDARHALAAAIAALEQDVERFASDVQKTKQAILDDAGIDNFIAIEAALDNTDTAAIKTLNVKIDGYPVYDLHDASGLWMPSKSLPLYSGPLQPGTHRIDLEARIVLRKKQNLPMNDDVYRLINKSFEIQIPGGAANNRYVIKIEAPDKLAEKADAVLKEVL